VSGADSQYAAAGVDLVGADQAKARIGQLVAGTRTALSVGHVGAFGGMVRVPADLRQPVLVLSTDGVGTKVLVALQAARFDTVGEDLVNHSVNDIVEGIARGCRNHGMALAGGETAQMPGLYQPGHYDLAGTIIGVVEESEAIHGDRIQPGDVLLAYASTGLHTNGYTLARRILFDRMNLAIDQFLPEADGTVADLLLAVHQSYVKSVTPVLSRLHGLAHITGGGIPGNLVRILPQGCEAVIDSGSWVLPPLFRLMQRAGSVSTTEMRDVFNLGVGLIAALPAADVAAAQTAASGDGVHTWVIGEVRAGPVGVRFTT
jgi:phosphoribosylformylglycinamidine cyclo-ligase